MKLQQVTLSGFRSIKNSENILIDPRTTVLIGANDHGKTNILAAILCLNDDNPITEEDRNWDLPQNKQPRIAWTFSLTEDELSELRDLSSAFESSNTIPAGEDTFLVQNQDGVIVFERVGIGSPVKVASLPVHASASFEADALKMHPRIELFSPPSTNLEDSTDLQELQSDFVMQGIFRLAGIWDDRDTIFTKTPVTSKRLDDASLCLTEALKDKWNQGKDLVWKLKHTGNRIEIEISDPSVSTRYSRPSVRSSGFRTYFLLSMITSAKTAGDPARPYLFLFDEPGTYLHPHAQIDLQRSFEKISERTQIIYTTHSLFLINKNHPGRNKVVSKTKDGTIVDQKPFRSNWKSVRDSLGILFSSNFLISEKTLLVEGPSDIIYILNAINLFKATKEIDLDLNDFSVVDAGNSENYAAMAKLMLSEGRTVVALVDGDKSGGAMAEKLKKSAEKEVKSKTLIILELPPQSSVENIFSDLQILRQASQNVAQNLVGQGIRELADADTDWTKELEQIKPTDQETLGRTFDRVTKGWFTPEEKLSKLSVALQYEDISKGSEISLDPRSKQWVEKVQNSLGIRGEASAEEGMYDEV